MSDLKKSGWVRLHRQIQDNIFYLSEPFTKSQAWIDLFLNANHKDGIFIVRGNVVNVKRGQIAWSELTMSSRWCWSKNKTRRFLKLLETEQQIEQQKTFITTIITIKNYDKYQTDDTANDTAERQQKDSRRYTNKNDNKKKNVKKEILEETSVDKFSQNGAEIIKYFEVINPACKLYYKNTTQRQACEDLIKEYGFDRVKSVIEKTLPKTNKIQYFPSITTPVQLFEKWATLESKINQYQSEKVAKDNKYPTI